jgi:multiple sugar transport system substrate-binding protein
MSKLMAIGAALVAVAALSVGAAQAKQDAVVKLTFYTYVWQPTTVKATKDIVAAWNKGNPNIQVELIQGDPNSVHDKLLTSFVGGTAADVIHDEAADIAGFSSQGYLADLTKLIPARVKSAMPSKIWQSVTFNGKITGVPTLLQTYNVFVNVPLLKQAGVKLPTMKDPWTWTEFRLAAKKLTKEGQYGVGWGLRSPAAMVMTVAQNFNGDFFYRQGGRTTFRFGAPEQQVPRRIHQMIFTDKSIDPVTVGQSGSAVLPGFFAGKYAMTVQGSFSAQGMILQSPKGFNWAMLPPLKGASQDQAANPQTFSIAQQSKNKDEAMRFIAFLVNESNLAKLAAGDWLIPTNAKSGRKILKSTKHAGSWRVAVNSLPFMTLAPFQPLTGYPRWKDQILQPNLREYFANRISLSELGKKLGDGWEEVGRGR